MNEIGYVRLNLGLTQAEVANLLGISRRSYQQYESEPSKVNTYKYKYFLEELNKQFQIDEEHGILTIEEITNTCKKVFKNHKVSSCYLFGSYAKNKAKGKSDVDLLIDTEVTGMAFFGLVEELRVALHKVVDLLDIRQVIVNPDLLKEILKDGIRIYRS